MKIVYLVKDASIVAGGMRVIIEQCNRLFAEGVDVQILQDAELATPTFTLTAPLGITSLEDIKKADVVVATDFYHMDLVDTSHTKAKKFFLAQHDYETLYTWMEGDDSTSWRQKSQPLFASNGWEVIVISTWLQSLYRDRYNITAHVVMNGVDTHVFSPSAGAVLQHTAPTVMLVHDAQTWKGFYDALEALSDIRGIRLIVMGSTYPSNETIDGKYHALSTSSTYFCRPSQDSIASIYRSADIFVSPSWLEGFGLPGLEAMASGVAVVTTNSGGINDYAKNRQNALIVPPQNPAALQSAIELLLNNQSLRERLVEHGLATASQFNWSDSIKALRTILGVA